MVLINGRKYACQACIRGHRASSCSHTARQMQLVRPKGRPSSQCEQCRARRAAGSFHGKCDCMPPSEGENSDGESSRASTEVCKRNKGRRKQGKAGEAHADRVDFQSINPTTPSQDSDTPSGKHSLANLMNPCRCRTTGICTCCKSSSAAASVSRDVGIEQGENVKSTPGDGCNCPSETICGSDEAPLACRQTSSDNNGGCCGGGSRPQPPKIDSNTDDCQCGPSCSCPGCCGNGDDEVWKRRADDCPERCHSCASCAYGLTRPSGIEAVDAWIAKDASADTKSEKEKQGVSWSRAPPLPPFSKAQEFYDSHFVDASRRAWFSEQRKNVMATESQPAQPLAPTHFGAKLSGESDASWQARHGFAHLTPDAIAIFDQSRAFRDQRAREEAALQ